MTRRRPSPRERIGAGAVTGAVTLLLGYALVAGLTVRMVPSPERLLSAFNLVPPPPPPPPVPPPAPRPAPAPKRAGKASPPNLKSRATDLAAPKPVVPIPIPPLMVTTPKPAIGSDASSGNALVAGPGTGSGGVGNGTGSGGDGDGDGGGGGIPPRQIGGKISQRDYPRDLFAAGVQGTVGVLYVVAVSGRVTDCQIEHSSGNRALDNATCDLIISRFRFRPSLDENGRPVESQIEENHSWVID